MNEIKEFLKDMFICFIEDVLPVVGMISFIILLMIGFSVHQYKAHEWKCEMKATVQGLKWSYRLGEGCMVKTDKGWMDYDRLIYTKGVK